MDIAVLSSTRYDRLKLYYEALRDDHFYSYGDFTKSDTEYHAPKEYLIKSNRYRKLIDAPINPNPNKKYVFSLYDKYFELYRKGALLYFIDSDTSLKRRDRMMAFGTSNMYQYVAMAIYELIQHLNFDLHKRIKVNDNVFTPIFNFPQWMSGTPEVILNVNWFPIHPMNPKSNEITLTIFK